MNERQCLTVTDWHSVPSASKNTATGLNLLADHYYTLWCELTKPEAPIIEYTDSISLLTIFIISSLRQSRCPGATTLDKTSYFNNHTGLWDVMMIIFVIILTFCRQTINQEIVCRFFCNENISCCSKFYIYNQSKFRSLLFRMYNKIISICIIDGIADYFSG